MASRVRCTNFSLDEIEILVGLVHQYKKVLECKSTDAVSNKEKEKVWEKLAMEFNAISSCGRSLKMLRSKWDSLKKATRKEYATLKNSLYKTGGGPSTDNNLGPIGTRVLEIIGLSDTGISCPYHGDYVVERKRPLLLGRKGAKKHSVQKNGHAALLLKKTALLDLQTRLFQEEHDLKEKRLQEKHDLEIKILKIDLQLKERQIKHS